jgi:hypothetical protein
MMNATANAATASQKLLTHALAAEALSDRVRVNTVCIHVGVAPLNGSKNQFVLG